MPSVRDSDFAMPSAASDSTKKKRSKLQLNNNNTKAKMSIFFLVKGNNKQNYLTLSESTELDILFYKIPAALSQTELPLSQHFKVRPIIMSKD